MRAIDIKATIKDNVLGDSFRSWLAEEIIRMAIDDKVSHIEIIDQLSKNLYEFFDKGKRDVVTHTHEQEDPFKQHLDTIGNNSAHPIDQKRNK